MLTGTLADPLSAAAVTSPMLKAGVSLSVIVTVPLSDALLVFPLATLPLTVKSSVGSPTRLSLIHI